MPELPEVETIANGLRQGGSGHPSILGHRIERAELLWERTLAAPTPDQFHRLIQAQTIENINRRGKYLQIQLTSYWLLVHLRMSGDLRVESSNTDIHKHHRLVLYLDQGLRLAFNDTRKFGRVWLVAEPVEITANLGPEPLDKALKANEFFVMLQKTQRQLKALLLDQTFLAGLGNIYTDEALHLSKLHPRTPANSLTKAKAATLLENVRLVLNKGILHHGASIDWVYKGGDFQNHFNVYRRTGDPCRTCGSIIERILVAQRSTHFCPTCQPPLETMKETRQ